MAVLAWAVGRVGSIWAGTAGGVLRGGRSRRAIRSFMWGTVDVATATMVGSVGESATEEGEKATQELEWGARFWDPSSSREGDGFEEAGWVGRR